MNCIINNRGGEEIFLSHLLQQCFDEIFKTSKTEGMDAEFRFTALVDFVAGFSKHD